MSSQADIIPAHVRAFSQLLITLRAELSNDLDLVLILAVISERYYARAAQADCPPPGTSDAASTNRALGINTLSVALYAAIPRETARRKIGTLVDKGWVKCDARGNLSPTEQAAGDLAKATAATLSYLDVITQTDQNATNTDQNDQNPMMPRGE